MELVEKYTVQAVTIIPAIYIVIVVLVMHMNVTVTQVDTVAIVEQAIVQNVKTIVAVINVIQVDGVHIVLHHTVLFVEDMMTVATQMDTVVIAE